MAAHLNRLASRPEFTALRLMLKDAGELRWRLHRHRSGARRLSNEERRQLADSLLLCLEGVEQCAARCLEPLERWESSELAQEWMDQFKKGRRTVKPLLDEKVSGP